MTLNAKIGGFYGFFGHFRLREYHSQGDATPLTPHAPMADV